MRYKTFLFDLDGTLTDPKEGICKCFQYGLKSCGIEPPELDELTKVIGPSLADSYQMFYGLDQEEAAYAVEKYRERFRDIGIYENKLLPGVVPMLEKLKENGASIALASAKPQVFALRILKHYGIFPYFDAVVGSELDGTRSTKQEVIQEAMQRLGAPQRMHVLMIGDRRHDIEGARACGVASVGVRFGYAEPGELEAAQPEFLVATVEELHQLLMGLLC